MKLISKIFDELITRELYGFLKSRKIYTETQKYAEENAAFQEEISLESGILSSMCCQSSH